MSLKVTGLQAGDARGVYRNTSHDLRNYKRMQMWVHAESLIDDATNLKSGELSLFIRLGTDIKNNFYEYEIPLTLTPHITSGNKYHDSGEDLYKVWPLSNRLDFALQNLVNLKKSVMWRDISPIRLSALRHCTQVVTPTMSRTGWR